MGEDRGRPAAGLAAVQAILYELITAPEGVASRLRERAQAGTGAGTGAALNLDDWVRPTARMTSTERVDVYANMYFYRILDVLRAEYPRVLATVGDSAFHNLVTDYLLECRPAHPSLREVGARLPEYLARRHPLGERFCWAGELARLERTHLELFDGEDSSTLKLEQVRQLAPAALPELELRAIPCHAVLTGTFQVSAAWSAVDGSITPPSTDPERPAAVPETLLVWRQELVVYHRPVDADEAALLPLLREGSSFATVCEHLLDRVEVDRATGRAFELLGRWITDGLLVDPLASGRDHG